MKSKRNRNCLNFFTSVFSITNTNFLKHLSILLLLNKNVFAKNNAEMSFFQQFPSNPKHETEYIDDLQKAAANLNLSFKINAYMEKFRNDHATMFHDEDRLVRLIEEESRVMFELGQSDVFYEDEKQEERVPRYKS